jgi:hypothetical protein
MGRILVFIILIAVVVGVVLSFARRNKGGDDR